MPMRSSGAAVAIDRGRRRFLQLLAMASAGCLLVPAQRAESATQGGSLQRRVAALVERMYRRGALGRGERCSWSVYDFTTGEQLLSINDSVPRQAASMIKPFVAQAFFFQAARSRVSYTPEVRRLMQRMIQHSDNAATNRLIERIAATRSGRGPKDVQAILQERAPDIFRQTRIVERIPPGGATYANRASAQDYNRFLQAIQRGRLPYSQEMRRLMRLPNQDRILRGVPAMPGAARVCDKTGSTARLCGDMGIIEIPDRSGRYHAYTLIGIIERSSSAASYGRWIRSRGNLIREVSALVYQEMKERHGLV